MDEHFWEPVPRRSRRSGLWSHLVVAVVAAVISGLTVATVMPRLLPQPEPTPQAETPTTVWPLPLTPEANELPVSQVTLAADAVSPAVVGVVNKRVVLDMFGRRRGFSEGSGSGLIVSADGHIVTNYHVIEGATELVVSLADGRQLPATIIGSDPQADIAVIRVQASDLPTARFGDSSSLRVGDLAIAIGNPVAAEFERTVTAGIVSGLNRLVEINEETALALIQTDASINPGNSGGPLVNGAGEVIGINTVKFSGVENMGFAIPSNTVQLIIEDLMTHGRVQRSYFGVLGATARQAAVLYNIQINEGMLIVQVGEGSPAATAGLRPGDVLLRLGGQRINSMAELRGFLIANRPGTDVTVTYERAGRKHEATIALGRAPER